MKKFLLPSMMAALAFAACTNEDLVSQQTAEAPKADLSKRPVVGQVDLNFGPQTRLGLDEDKSFNSIEWKPGDKMGARIIDEPNFQLYKNHSVRYDANDQYASSNYEYTRDEAGDWTTEALMVEGHYMFYAPYDASARDRSPLEIKFPLEQEVNPASELMKGVNVDAVRKFFGNEDGYTVGIGHAFIDASKEETKYKPEFTHLYAYPELTLVNNVKDMEWTADVEAGEGEEDRPGVDLVIDSIKIKGDGIYEKYKAIHSNIMTALRDEVTVDNPNKNDNPELYDNSGNRLDGCENYTTYIKRGYWRALSDTTVYNMAETNDILEGVGTDKKEVLIKFTSPLKLTPGQKYKLNVILPAQKYDDLSVEVYSGEDVLYKDLGAEDCQFELGKVTYTPGKRYPHEEYNFKDYVASPKQSAGTLATVELSGEFDTYVAPAKNYIESLGDFGKWLARYVKANTENLEESNAVAEGETLPADEFRFAADNAGYSKVELNQDLMDTVAKYLEKGTITFKSNFYVQGDVKMDDRILAVGDIKNVKDKTADFTVEHDMNIGRIAVTNVTLTMSEDTENTVGDVTAANKAELTNVTVGKVSAKSATLTDVTATGLSAGATLTNAVINGKATFNGNSTITSATIGSDIAFNNGISSIIGLEQADGKKFEITKGSVTIENNATVVEAISVLGGELIIEKEGYAGAVTVGKTKEVDGVTVSDKTGTVTLNADYDLTNLVLKSGDVTIADGTAINPATFQQNWVFGTLTNNATMNVNQFIIKEGQEYVHNGELISLSLNIMNSGKITNYKNLEVGKNNGEIVAMQSSSTTVKDGEGDVNNNAKAKVRVEGGNQTVYYEFAANEYAELDNAALNAFESAKYGINKLIFNQALSLDDSENIALDGVKTVDFKSGSSLYIDGLIGSSIREINILGNVTFSGFAGLDDAYAVGFGFKYGGALNIAPTAKLSVVNMNIATMVSTPLNITLETETVGTTVNTGKLFVDGARIGIGTTGIIPAFTSANGGEVVNKYYNGAWN